MFSHWTYNTYADRYELMMLDNDPDSPVRVFYSEPNVELTDQVELVYRVSADSEPRLKIQLEALDQGFAQRLFRATDQGWVPAAHAVFQQ